MQSSQLVIRMLKELTEYSNSIKKTQAEMKVTLSEIKKNLQGINSGVDETENQINDCLLYTSDAADETDGV